MHSDLTISQVDPRPMYLQIVEQIRHRVAVGDWTAGQEIPSIRTLAVATRVSVITVKRAYLELEREGVIVTRQGKGSFVSDSVDLGTSLLHEQLNRNLAAALDAARQLGLTARDVEVRLREIAQDRSENSDE